MKLEDLGYSKKWIDYGLLTIETLRKQFSEFQKGDRNREHYRYATFVNWLNEKIGFSDLEIKQFIELAVEDSNQLMAGSAIKNLFIHSKISTAQSELIKNVLPEFGPWTNQFIQREELKKRVESENLTEELIKKCIDHREKFKENILIELIIKKSDKIETIAQFAQNGYGKSVRNLANEKLNMLGTEKNKN